MPAKPVEQPISQRMKRCTKCERVRPLDLFYKCPQARDGLFNECKGCHGERRERNRKLARLGGPLTFTDAGRLSGVIFSAMELGVQSPRTLARTLELLEKVLEFSAQERSKKAANRTAWDQLRALAVEFPDAERLEMLKAIASTLPTKMRPTFKFPGTGAVHSNPQAVENS
jgi:hypothetical protein